MIWYYNDYYPNTFNVIKCHINTYDYIDRSTIWDCQILFFTLSPIHCWWEYKWYSNLIKVSYKVKQILSIWPNNLTPMFVVQINESICPHKHFYVNIRSSFFTIAPNWKQPKSLPSDEWIKILCYIHAIEYY